MPKYIGTVVARFAPGESFYYMNNGRPVEAVVDKVVAKFSNDEEETFLMVASDGPLGIGAMIKDNHAFRTAEHAINFTTLGITPKEYEPEELNNEEVDSLKAIMDAIGGPYANPAILIPKTGETIQVTTKDQPQETDGEIIEEAFSQKAGAIGVPPLPPPPPAPESIAQLGGISLFGEIPEIKMVPITPEAFDGEKLPEQSAPEEIPAAPAPEPEPVKKSRKKSAGKEDTLK